MRRLAAVLGLCALLPFGRAHDGLHERIESLTAELARAPSAALHVRRGECQRMHGQPDLARADAEAALRLDPAVSGGRTLLALALLDLSRSAEAGRAADDAIRGGEDNVSTRLVRARARRAQGEPGAAAEDFAAAARAARPPDPEIVLEWSRLLAADPAAGPLPALDAVAEGLRLTGPCLALDLEAVRLERQAARWDRALARLDELARRFPQPGHWAEQRGDLLAAAGRADEARAAYAGGLRELDSLSPAVRQRGLNTALARRLAEKAGVSAPR